MFAQTFVQEQMEYIASKFRVTGLCKGNPLATGGFPSQWASDAGNVSIWWRHHDEVINKHIAAWTKWPTFRWGDFKNTFPPQVITRMFEPTAWLQMHFQLKWNMKLSISSIKQSLSVHDDVIKWKHFPRHWPFVRGIHRSRWIPRTKASDAELWCFLWSASEQAID